MLTTNQLPGSVRALKAPPPGIRQARPPPTGQGPPASHLPPPLRRGRDTDGRLSLTCHTRASLGFRMGHLPADLHVVPFPHLSFILTVLSCVNNSLSRIVLYGKYVNVPRRVSLTSYSGII